MRCIPPLRRNAEPATTWLFRGSGMYVHPLTPEPIGVWRTFSDKRLRSTPTWRNWLSLATGAGRESEPTRILRSDMNGRNFVNGGGGGRPVGSCVSAPSGLRPGLCTSANNVLAVEATTRPVLEVACRHRRQSNQHQLNCAGPCKADCHVSLESRKKSHG